MKAAFSKTFQISNRYYRVRRVGLTGCQVFSYDAVLNADLTDQQHKIALTLFFAHVLRATTMKNTCAITTEHCAARSSVYDTTFKKMKHPFFILFKNCKLVFKLHLGSSELHKKTRHLQRESSVKLRINSHLAPF